MMIKLPFNRILSISLKRRPNVYTFGITNRASNNLFVFFADYDLVELSVVEEDAKFFQQNYNMGAMLINVSSTEKDLGEDVGNYHLIGFKLYTFPEMRELINLSRCDDHFKRGCRYQQRSWVLRVGEKLDKNGNVIKEAVRPLKVLPSKVKYDGHNFSGGHITFFNTMLKRYDFDIDIKTFFAKEYIEDTDIELINYETKGV